MSVFPTEAHLSSWIGVCPGNRISAGINKSSRICRGNRWARTTLVECAWAAASKKDCYLKERFWKLSVKGRKPALIAIAHALATLIYRTLRTRSAYQEPGQTLPEERKRQRLIRHYVRRLGRLGIVVAIRPETSRSNKCAAGTRTLDIHKTDQTNPPSDNFT